MENQCIVLSGHWGHLTVKRNNSSAPLYNYSPKDTVSHFSPQHFFWPSDMRAIQEFPLKENQLY